MSEEMTEILISVLQEGDDVTVVLANDVTPALVGQCFAEILVKLQENGYSMGEIMSEFMRAAGNV